ncbi:hypothetical protein HQN64_20220 [Enterobacteriaceae bacterium BIT-l23]|uniref:hypothetical protein n=1 Tax=Jejubacter sp. L23 TaxID=3092086 RepID=UPI0015848461|nr:hypothetical protein [Enterobacteriaceae bacterium BIT-l23]
MTLEQRIEALEREVSELKQQARESNELVTVVQHATQAAAHDLQQIVAQQQATKKYRAAMSITVDPLV